MQDTIGSSALSATSFCDAIHIESLATACISALNSDFDYVDRHGLKRLRLVSKQVNAVMLGSIRGYSLIVDGVSDNLPDGDMLKSTQLSWLSVRAKSDAKDSFSLDHVTQVQKFIIASGPALHTVTTIYLTVSHEEHWTESCTIPGKQMAAVLSPFANACPKLQKLYIAGAVGAPLLAAFGNSCKQLTKLDTTDVPPDTLEQLGNILPLVTSTHMMLFEPARMEIEALDDGDQAEEFRSALSSCRTLVKLDTGGAILEDESWLAMPSSLQDLCTHTPCEAEDLEYSGPPAGVQLPNLQLFSTHCQDMPLCLLANLLRAAPQLQSVHLRLVRMPCSVDQIPDLLLLGKRLSSGLVLEVDEWRGGYIHNISGANDGKRFVLCITDLAEETTESEMLLFATRLPVLSCVVGLELHTVEQSVLAQLGRAFPHLRGLKVHAEIETGGLPDLSVFPLLQAVDFSCWKNSFSIEELEAVCLANASLIYINSHSAILPGDVACNALMVALQARGRTVQVGEPIFLMKRFYMN